MNLKTIKRLILRLANSRRKWILPIGLEIVGLLIFMMGFFYYLRFVYNSKPYPGKMITKELVEEKQYYYDISGSIMTYGGAFLLSGLVALIAVNIINSIIRKEIDFIPSDFYATRKSRFNLRLYLKYTLLLVPLLIPFAFNLLYQPINENVTVEHFGCGCPRLDGTYDFNTNNFNANIWLLISFLSVLFWSYLIKIIVIKRYILKMELIGIFMLLFFSMFYYARSIWL